MYMAHCLYSAHSKLRRRRTTILRAQLCSSLLLLLLGYVGHIFVYYTTTLPQDIPETCAVISVVTHYFTLTSLVWLGAEALHMLRKLAFGKRYGNPSNLYFIIVSVVSWRKYSILFMCVGDRVIW